MSDNPFTIRVGYEQTEREEMIPQKVAFPIHVGWCSAYACVDWCAVRSGKARQVSCLAVGGNGTESIVGKQNRRPAWSGPNLSEMMIFLPKLELREPIICGCMRKKRLRTDKSYSQARSWIKVIDQCPVMDLHRSAEGGAGMMVGCEGRDEQRLYGVHTWFVECRME